MELRYRSSRLNKLTVLTTTLPYLALVSLIGCGVPGKDREEVGRFLHREQFTHQYLAGPQGSNESCLGGTSWDFEHPVAGESLETNAESPTQKSYTEYNYNGEPDIVIVHSRFEQVPPLVFRAEGDNGALVPDSEMTQRQLNAHGC